MFPPPHFKYASVAQLVEQRTENPRVVGSIPTGGTTCKSLAGICGHSSSGRAPPCQGGGSEFEPRCPLQKNSYAGLIARITYIRRHSQVVRQRTANPRFPSSNLGGASNKKPALWLVFYWKCHSLCWTGSATVRFAGLVPGGDSNLGGASKNRQASKEVCRFLLLHSSLFTLH